MLDCLFIGSATKDTLLMVEAPPASDQRIAASAVVHACGGVASVAASAFQKLGGSAGLITVVGRSFGCHGLYRLQYRGKTASLCGSDPGTGDGFSFQYDPSGSKWKALHHPFRRVYPATNIGYAGQKRPG